MTQQIPVTIVTKMCCGICDFKGKLAFVLACEVTALKMVTKIVYHRFRRRTRIRSNTRTLANSAGHMHYIMDRKMHPTYSREKFSDQTISAVRPTLPQTKQNVVILVRAGDINILC
jgi:hypothetical protein